KNGDDQLLELLVALPAREREFLESPHQLDVAADCLPGIGDPETDKGNLQLVGDEAQRIQEDALLLGAAGEKVVDLVERQKLDLHALQVAQGLHLKLEHGC